MTWGRDELDTGHIIANARVAESLFRKATGEEPTMLFPGAGGTTRIARMLAPYRMAYRFAA